MSFHEIDDTLVAYFKQMLDEEVPTDETEQSAQEVATHDLSVSDEEISKLEAQDSLQAKVQDAQNDYIAPSYDPETLKVNPSYQEIKANEVAQDDLEPQLQVQEETKTQTESLPFAEHPSLQSLLEDLETKVKPVTQTQVVEDTKVAQETKTETQTETQTATETQVAKETTKVVTHDKEVATEQELQETPKESPYEWKNIEMPNDFQALFFQVRGIRFAVPLVDLGGIFQCDKITPLFGKPKWFMGIADIRGRKMNVVDTIKWVKSDVEPADKYEYMIALGKTLWSIGCDKLEGNKILHKDNVTWRENAGNRPWLAGIVKKEMCALLHVDALIKMFENGVNLKDLDLQMSE